MRCSREAISVVSSSCRRRSARTCRLRSARSSALGLLRGVDSGSAPSAAALRLGWRRRFGFGPAAAFGLSRSSSATEPMLDVPEPDEPGGGLLLLAGGAELPHRELRVGATELDALRRGFRHLVD